MAGVACGALHRKLPPRRSSAMEPEGRVNVFPVSACVTTNATPAGGAMEAEGEVGAAVGVPGPGRAVDGLAFGVGVPVLAGVATGATVVAAVPAVAVGVLVAVGGLVAVGDNAAALAPRWCVQPARATSPATTAQRPAR